MEEKNLDATLTLKIEQATLDALSQRAEAAGMTRSELVRLAIDRILKRAA